MLPKYPTRTSHFGLPLENAHNFHIAGHVYVCFCKYGIKSRQKIKEKYDQ